VRAAKYNHLRKATCVKSMGCETRRPVITKVERAQMADVGAGWEGQESAQ
jgi:hypothetical protein